VEIGRLKVLGDSQENRFLFLRHALAWRRECNLNSAINCWLLIFKKLNAKAKIFITDNHRAKATVQKKNYARHKQKKHHITKHKKHENSSCSI